MGLIGFYAGSFDPFTNGHLQIVKKAAKCFDKVIIGIGSNTDKPVRINKNKMKHAVEATIKDLKLHNVEVVLYDCLTINKAKELNSDILIRGLRNGTDYQYEENIAQMNDEIGEMDTCYFRAGKLGYLSSSLVMELYTHNEDVSKFVPKPVFDLLRFYKEGI